MIQIRTDLISSHAAMDELNKSNYLTGKSFQLLELAVLLLALLILVKMLRRTSSVPFLVFAFQYWWKVYSVTVS